MEMVVTSLKNEILNEIKEKFLKYKKDHFLCDPGEEIEIYTDYRDRHIDTHTLKFIFETEKPEDTFYEMLNEWAIDYTEQIHSDLTDDLFSILTEEETDFWSNNDNDVQLLIDEIFTFSYNKEDFNDYIKCNIMVDLAEDKALYYDDVLQYDDKKFHKNSTMLWLAGTQCKADALRKAVKDYTYDREPGNDPFIESCIAELENLTYSTGTLTFLVEIPLLKVFQLFNLQRENVDAKLVFSKDTMCGLFDPTDGAGSLLEVNLDKDVKLPVKNAIICIEGTNNQCRYDVDETYGLIGSCWKPLKDISLM